MIREIVEVAEETIILKLPKNLIGKKVEVVAYDITEQPNDGSADIPFNPEKLKDIQERYDKLPRISHENYKFDRDEANNYE